MHRTCSLIFDLNRARRIYSIHRKLPMLLQNQDFLKRPKGTFAMKFIYPRIRANSAINQSRLENCWIRGSIRYINLPFHIAKHIYADHPLIQKILKLKLDSCTFVSVRVWSTLPQTTNYGITANLNHLQKTIFSEL